MALKQIGMGSESGKCYFFLINFIKQQNIVKDVTFGIFSEITGKFMRTATGGQWFPLNYKLHNFMDFIHIFATLFHKGEVFYKFVGKTVIAHLAGNSFLHCFFQRFAQFFAGIFLRRKAMSFSWNFAAHNIACFL